MNPHERFLKKEEVPSENQIKRSIGKNAVGQWIELTNYITDVYNIEPVLVFGGKNYG